MEHLKSKFKYIQGIYESFLEHRCKTCGKQETLIFGTLKGTKTRSYYDTSLNKRHAYTCFSCLEKRKKPKARYCSVHFHTCQVCSTKFSSNKSKHKFCSRKCNEKYQNQKRYKKYNLKCKQCNTSFVHNKKRKFCSKQCEKESRKAIATERTCPTCNSVYKAVGNRTYCSDSCLPSKPKKEHRKCISCDNQVKLPAKKCSTCKKPKPRKKLVKNCKTCGKEFSTYSNAKQYCKPSHSIAARGAKSIRKRSVRQAKLKIETWNDIAEFKKTRPKGHQLDHIIPLNHPDVCGLHNTWNFQWLTPEENVSKSNQFDGTMENNSWKE